jgi:hypothetical protein
VKFLLRTVAAFFVLIVMLVGHAEAQPCGALATALTPDAAQFEGWQLGPITPKQGTLEALVLRSSDGAPLSLEIRKSIWLKDPETGELQRPAYAHSVKAVWRGPAPEPGEIPALSAWLRSQIQTQPEAVEEAFASLDQIEAGSPCAGGEVRLKSTASQISQSVQESFVAPEDHLRTPGSPWFSWALILIFALLCAASIRAQWTARERDPSWIWWCLGALTLGFTGLVFWLPDVVLHENYHGFETIRVVARGSDQPLHAFEPYGFMHVALSRVFGFFASDGHQTFFASRLAGALCIPVAYLFFRALSGRASVALVGSAFLSIQPSFLYAARAETVVTTGLLLVLLSAWLCMRAGQLRSLRALAVATASCVLLANFRLTGPILTPFCMALVLGARPASSDPSPSSKHWTKALVGAALLILVLSYGHLSHALEAVSSGHGGRYGMDYYPPLLLAQSWVPWFVALTGLGGLIFGLKTQRWRLIVLLASMVTLSLATMPAANSWLSTVRYQTWLLLPVCLGLGYGLVHLGSTDRALRFGFVLIVLLAILGSLVTPYRLSRTLHPEKAQLEIWRAGYQALPQKARVAIPTGEHGRFNLQVPDVELKASRPDIDLRAFSQLKDRADLMKDVSLFAFMPLQCRVDLARDAVPSDGRPSECGLFDELGTWVPFYVRSVEVKVPRESLKGWWNLHPYPKPSVTIGFYRLTP